MNKILIGIIIIVVIVLFLNRETFNNASMKNASMNKASMNKASLDVYRAQQLSGPCSKPRFSKEVDLDPTKNGTVCIPLDTQNTAYYNFRGTTVNCPKNKPVTVTFITDTCIANGTAGNCAGKGPTTGLVVKCAA